MHTIDGPQAILRFDAQWCSSASTAADVLKNRCSSIYSRAIDHGNN